MLRLAHPSLLVEVQAFFLRFVFREPDCQFGATVLASGPKYEAPIGRWVRGGYALGYALGCIVPALANNARTGHPGL